MQPHSPQKCQSIAELGIRSKVFSVIFDPPEDGERLL